MSDNNGTDVPVDDRNNGPKVLAITWSLFGFCTIFLCLRVYAKWKRHRGLWLDDYTLIASWVSFIVALAQLVVNTHYGFGKPGLQIDPEYSYRVGFGGLITGMFIMIAPALSKTSFILTLSRIAGPKLKIGLWVVAVTSNLFQVAAIVVQWALCRPIEKIWNPFLLEGECWDFDINLGFSMGAAIYSGLIDLVLAAVPWIILKDLQMKQKEKIGIAVAMSLGVVAAGTAFAKCAKLKLLQSSDFTLEGGELIIWASTEIATTIVAASIPVLRTLVKDLSTRGVSGPSGGYFRSTAEDGTMRRTTKTDGAGNITVTGRNDVSPDEASDKSILYEGKILKTDEVVIKYTNREDGGYEMDHMPGRQRDRRYD